MVLIPLGLTAAAPAIDEAIHKNVFGSGNETLISNEAINDIMKIVKSPGEFGLLIKGVRKQSKSKQKIKKGDFWVFY